MSTRNLYNWPKRLVNHYLKWMLEDASCRTKNSYVEHIKRVKFFKILDFFRKKCWLKGELKENFKATFSVIFPKKHWLKGTWLKWHLTVKRYINRSLKHLFRWSIPRIWLDKFLKIFAMLLWIFLEFPYSWNKTSYISLFLVNNYLVTAVDLIWL